MNAPAHKPQPADAPTLQINLSGPPELVTRLLAGMHNALAGQAPEGEPTKLFLNSADASAYTGLSIARLSGLVRVGKLTNHGKGRILLLSRAELSALAQQED